VYAATEAHLMQVVLQWSASEQQPVISFDVAHSRAN
jgi:hypothetical protein